MNSAPATGHRPCLSRIPWIGAAVFIGLIVWLVVWVVGAVGEAREAARRTNCQCHFCCLKIALLNYHEVYRSFPPAYVVGPDGNRWHSWRTLLLPFVDQQQLYDQYRFDEPWDSPHNQRLAETSRVPWLQCPSTPGYERTPHTNYVVIVGEGTFFPGAATASADTADEPDETILIAEVAEMDIHWMEPRDLELESMAFDINVPGSPCISSPHGGGAHVIHAGSGCQTVFLTSGLTEAELRSRLTIRHDTQE